MFQFLSFLMVKITLKVTYLTLVQIRNGNKRIRLNFDVPTSEQIVWTILHNLFLVKIRLVTKKTTSMSSRTWVSVYN